MGKINILHISDTHINAKSRGEVSKLVGKLCDDIKKVQNEKRIKIDLVCFSGDLIHDGKNAIDGEGQVSIADEIFICPLLDSLGLSREKFIIVPGNHEVDASGINVAIEKGLNALSVGEIWDNFDGSFIERLEYFYKLLRQWYPEAYYGKLGYSLNMKIKETLVGIVCLDSSWRSAGKGTCERGSLVVCRKQIEDLYDQISDAQLKVCMLHHPTDWLREEEFREIERALTGFDVVLNGHVHENDVKSIGRSNGKTIFSTSGKLYPFDELYGGKIDGFNGYSILSIDTEHKNCKLFLRTYYARNREEFGPAENLVEGGELEFRFEGSHDDKLLEYDLLEGIRNYLSRGIDKLAYVKANDGKNGTIIEDFLIEPNLSTISDYVSENNKESAITLDEIIEQKENQLLIGKKECGKTTILQAIGLRYINQFSKFNKIPVYVDAERLKRGSEKFFISSYVFVATEAVDETASISKEQYRVLLNEGRIVLLIDNFDVKSADSIVQLNKFMEMFPATRCLVTMEEDFFHSVDIKTLPSELSGFSKAYIQNFGKNQVRQLVSKWSGTDIDKSKQLAAKIDSYCNKINLAKTPFNISIFMLIWDNDGNYIPTNEGILMENYLEILLEKLSPAEANRDNYSFAIKEDFLANFAYYLYKQEQRFYISYEGFVEFVTLYHKTKGYSIHDTSFDRLFFDKSILVLSDEQVSFSRTSFLEFFLAIYATKHEEFLYEMLEDDKRAFFRNEICFYAGLKDDCRALLDKLSDKLMDTIIENFDLIEGLNDLEIMTEFKLDKEDFLREVKESRPSIEEVDSLSDDAYEYKEQAPSEIKKSNTDNSDSAYDFISTIQIYGGVLKNAELLDNDDKIKHLENYMYGMNMLYAIMIQLLKELKDSYRFEDLDEEQKAKLHVSSEQEYLAKSERFIEFTKIAFPMAVQRLIMENVGTPKIKAAIDHLIAQKEKCPFEKFMLTFLKADLGLIGIRKDLKPYIKNEKSISIIKLIHLKLTYYYQMHYFSKDLDDDLLDAISETVIRLDIPNRNRGVADYRRNKSIVTKEVKRQLDRNSKDII